MITYIITTETFPNGMAATQRIRCYAKAISEKEKCEVIVANRLEDSLNPLGNESSFGSIGKYTFRYVGGSTKKIRNRILSSIIRILDVTSLVFFLLRTLKSDDRILFYSYSIPFLHIITKVAHARGGKVFYDLCEHPSIQCSSCPKEDGKDLTWMRQNLSDVDGIIVISKALEMLVEKAFDGEMPSLKIPIMYECPLGKNDYKVENYEVPYIMHTGSLTQRKDGILHSLKAFALAVNNNGLKIDYLLTGNIDKSQDKEEIQKIIEENNLKERIHFLGFLSNEDMMKYQQNAYMTIINKEDNLQNRFCFATKLCEYLNAGCLLVTTNVGEVCNYLSDGKDCVFFSPGDIDKLSEIIVDFFEDKNKRETIAKSGKLVSDNYFYCMHYTDKLISFMKNV